MPIKPTTLKIPDTEKAMLKELAQNHYGRKFMVTQFILKLIREAYGKFKT